MRGEWMMSSESGESFAYKSSFTSHNRLVHGQNLRVVNDIMSPWIKHCEKTF